MVSAGKKFVSIPQNVPPFITSPLTSRQIVPYLTAGVVIACENSPESVTISGDADKLDEVMAALKEAKPDAFNRLLRVEKAYHSREYPGNIIMRLN